MSYGGDSEYTVGTDGVVGGGIAGDLWDGAKNVAAMPVNLVQRVSGQSWNMSLAIIIALVLFLFWYFPNLIVSWRDMVSPMRSGISSGAAGHYGRPSQSPSFDPPGRALGVYGVTGGPAPLAQTGTPYFPDDGTESFLNGREQPYFPDVTNRVLRMENREREAVRALGKINQERLRRSAAEVSADAPMPWGPFWSEWKSTHPMDDETSYSGFTSGGAGGDALW